MDNFEIIEQLYQGHYCSNCGDKVFCKKSPNCSTCKEWKKGFDVSSILNVVRASYPSSIKGELIKEFALPPPPDNIFYLKPIYTKDEEKK